MAQPPHFNIDGAIYFVTTRLKEKRASFSPDERTIVHQTILELAREGKLKLYAYMVMPDHLHLLIQPTNGQIPQTMKLVKGRASRRINQGILWQKGYFDFVILSEEKFKEKLNYIHSNAVKDGLVQRAEDYPYSSARAYKERYGEVFYSGEE